jgi:hypothetical protein
MKKRPNARVAHVQASPQAHAEDNGEQEATHIRLQIDRLTRKKEAAG